MARPQVALTLVVALAGCGPVPGAGSEHLLRFVDYLRADAHTRLVIEVDAVPGYEPRASSAEALVEGLTPLVDKPGGIDVVLDGTLAPVGADHAWTFGELADLARATDDLEVPGDTLKMHVLFVDGHDADETTGNETLGLSWSYTSVAIFAGTLERACGRIGDPDTREAVCAGTELWVWTHETGHLLGLVNLGVPMIEDHEDPDHLRHDSNPGCVMYWATRAAAVVDRVARRVAVRDTTPIGFDAACQADLAAVREGSP